MKTKLYDPIYDNLVIEEGNLDCFKKQKVFDVIDAGVPKDSYVTYEELESHFGLSHYQILNCLEKINARPLGIKKNIVNGKRSRGVGKFVFDRKVIEDINISLQDSIDINKIKAMAAQIKNSYEQEE